MFNPLKGLGDLKAMRDQAMAIQKELSGQVLNINRNGYEVQITGDQKVQYIKDQNGQNLDGLVEAVNEAIKKSQEEAAKKLATMSGGLGGLLK